METIKQKNISAADYKNYFTNGTTFKDYFLGVEKDAALNANEGQLSYVPMNLQRMKRILKTMQLTEEIKQAIKNLKERRNWLLISEHWCGDASQISPVIHTIAENSNDMIDLRIVYRDKNPELIDAHLTNNARDIPKLIQLDSDFNITGIWGPRPIEAQTLVKKLKSNPETAATYAESLHKWYTADKQQAIQNELLELLK